MILTLGLTLLISAIVSSERNPATRSRGPLAKKVQLSSGEQAVLIRAVHVNFVEMYKNGLLSQYVEMREFVARKFSVEEYEGPRDLHQEIDSQGEMWLYLPVPPAFQAKGAFEELATRWPMFIDPELAELCSMRARKPEVLSKRLLPIPSSTKAPRFYLAVSEFKAISSWPSKYEAWSAVRRLPKIERDVVYIVEVNGGEKRIHPNPPPMTDASAVFNHLPDSKVLYDAFVEKYNESGMPLDSEWMQEKARDLGIPGEAVSKVYRTLSSSIGIWR